MDGHAIREGAMSGSKVSVVRCDRYEPELVAERVHAALEHLGGLGLFVKSGQKVLLKPNMLSAKAPERAITTHPSVLEAMVREVQALGADASIGDSPSGALKGVKRCWENTGFLSVSERTGAPLVNFEAGGTIIKEIEGNRYHLARSVLEADVVVNLPKFKTHGLTLYTGAIKNCFGTLPGFQKATLHKRFPHPTDFSRVLVDVYAAVRPAVTLMDGVLGMEGNGPATGGLREAGLLFASADGVALDAVAAAVMGFKEGEVDAIRIASQRGIGTAGLADIEIAGEALADVRIPDFKLPSNHLAKLMPPFVARWLGRWLGQFVWVRPRADLNRCTGCAICAHACPVQAIRMVHERPVTDYDKCINCLCCNESCPEGAVIQELSWLARRLG
jgi:uncharacterized protein (DUF362 family)/Pyruvate/2-oxoacid:ferredoxin oxidoreductase delta subunit